MSRSLKQQLSTRPQFPAGHVVAIAYARVFGPKLKKTPEGHPIQISSGPFDNTVETAVHAIARAAQKWHGIVIKEDDWELVMEEDIIQPTNRPAIPYSRLYYFRYKPEQAMWTQRGLHDGNVANHFRDSHYVSRNWKHTPVDKTSGHRVKPKG